MISTWEDMDKVLVTMPYDDMVRHSLAIAREEEQEREEAAAAR